MEVGKISYIIFKQFQIPVWIGCMIHTTIPDPDSTSCFAFCNRVAKKCVNSWSACVIIFSRLWRNWRPKLQERVLLVEPGWRRAVGRSSHLAMVASSLWDLSKPKLWHGFNFSKGQNSVPWWSPQCLEAAECDRKFMRRLIHIQMFVLVIQRPGFFLQESQSQHQLFWRNSYGCSSLNLRELWTNISVPYSSAGRTACLQTLKFAFVVDMICMYQCTIIFCRKVIISTLWNWFF